MSTNKILKVLSVYIYTEREVIESDEFWDMYNVAPFKGLQGAMPHLAATAFSKLVFFLQNFMALLAAKFCAFDHQSLLTLHAQFLR